MVVVNINIGGQWLYIDRPEEVSESVARVLASLSGEVSTPVYNPGDDAWFMIGDRKHESETDLPDNFLRVSVNWATGFGGMVWFLSSDSSTTSSVGDSVWVSNNPQPPDFDPRVVADPGGPVFHDRRSALPISQVAEVVERFCIAATGDRPSGVDWVQGDVAGRRADRQHEAELPEVDPFA
ncbi:Imm1 family immunity protein [Micromonospora sp. NPDC005313]|uniref:Imm1 family immunity protein n=1 Tax=Micromonospora sp. NPDC005313 TaxID=3154296 RepID=UPI0033A01808